MVLQILDKSWYFCGINICKICVLGASISAILSEQEPVFSLKTPFFAPKWCIVSAVVNKWNWYEVWTMCNLVSL